MNCGVDSFNLRHRFLGLRVYAGIVDKIPSKVKLPPLFEPGDLNCNEKIRKNSYSLIG
jgi:hypothetical protein